MTLLSENEYSDVGGNPHGIIVNYELRIMNCFRELLS